MKLNITDLSEMIRAKDSELIEEIKFRNRNRAFITESKKIALKILIALDDQKISQRQFAEMMGVTPQYVNKLVKGGENLTLENLIKIQDTLGISILASHQKEARTIKEKTSFQLTVKYSSIDEFTVNSPNIDKNLRKAE